MSLLIIDESNCKQDGICAMECPTSIIRVKKNETYLELAALPMGLGTCWAGLLQGVLRSWQHLKEALGIPEEYPHHYPLMLGYPQFKYHRLPERKEPKITWR
jgi:hypothetical protein